MPVPSCVDPAEMTPHERLRELAQRTQAGLIAELDHGGAEYRSFWAANMIWVRGSLGLLGWRLLRVD